MFLDITPLSNFVFADIFLVYGMSSQSFNLLVSCKEQKFLKKKKEVLDLDVVWCDFVICICNIMFICNMLLLLSCSVVSLCDPMDCSPPGSSVHGDSPGKNTGVGSLSLLQEIFPTQESNLCHPHCRWILYQAELPGKSICNIIFIIEAKLKCNSVRMRMM